jgi:membrane fusion protein (multidrug efflux system)
MAIMLIAVGLVMAGLVGYNMFKGVMIKKMMSGMASALQTVSTIKVGYEEWQPKLESVGSVRAVKGADLAVETAGIVDSVHFESDSDVKAGQVLIQLRVGDDAAKLQSLIATEKLAEITLERDKKQFEVQAVSQATLDADQAAFDSAKAARQEQEATIAKKTITAPFSGRAGIRLQNVGQYVTAGSTMVTLQQLDPIYVDFYLPEQSIREVKAGQKVQITTEAFPDQKLTGEVTAVDPKVAADTRNVMVQATLKNPDRLLVPGMFANVKVLSGKPVKKLTLPQAAITFNPYGNTVYVVEEKKVDSKDKKADAAKQLVVRQTFVTTGETRGDQVSILSGLKEGEEVVTSGQMKLRNGAAVKINNDVQPSNDPDPKPHEE